MRNSLYLFILLIATGCDPSFHLFISNETNEDTEIKVLVEYNNLPDIDSIKLFDSSEKINWKSYDSATMATIILKDTIEGSYKFIIKPRKITLLQPTTIATLISCVIIDGDTTFFYSKEKISKEKRFSKIGQFKYIKRIN